MLFRPLPIHHCVHKPLLTRCHPANFELVNHQIGFIDFVSNGLFTAQASTCGREPIAQYNPEFGSGALYDPSFSVHISFGIIVTGPKRKSNVGSPFNVSDPYPYI